MFPYVEILINLRRCQPFSFSWDTIRYLNKESDGRPDFIYPRSRYYGQVKPETWFSMRICRNLPSRLCNLETAGKLARESYQQIRDLWEQLKRSKKQLRIGEDPFRSNEGPEAGGRGDWGREKLASPSPTLLTNAWWCVRAGVWLLTIPSVLLPDGHFAYSFPFLLLF